MNENVDVITSQTFANISGNIKISGTFTTLHGNFRGADPFISRWVCVPEWHTYLRAYVHVHVFMQYDEFACFYSQFEGLDMISCTVGVSVSSQVTVSGVDTFPDAINESHRSQSEMNPVEWE